jgi:hypothetical protein
MDRKERWTGRRDGQEGEMDRKERGDEGCGQEGAMDRKERWTGRRREMKDVDRNERWR